MFQFFQWGILLQVLAVVHFIRRRPDTFWLWIIVFFGPIGASIYILMEVVPDLGLLRQAFEGFGRRKRIKYLEAVVQQNPAAGNYGWVDVAGIGPVPAPAMSEPAPGTGSIPNSG